MKILLSVEDQKKKYYYISVLPFSVTPESLMEEQESFENRQNVFFFFGKNGIYQLDMEK